MKTEARGRKTSGARLARSEQVFDAILRRIRDARNFDFRDYKKATLERRIARRMEEKRCKTAEEYLRLLGSQPEEIDALVSAMLIKVTSFFREEVWKELERRLIPAILESHPRGEELRIWSAGCATGEEVFSIAMLFAEAMGRAFVEQNIRIFGTDVDEAAIAFARRATYSSEAMKAVPDAFAAKYFAAGPEGFTVKKEIRRTVVFGANNLANDAPISRLDLILCRNVFIYLDARLQDRVLMRFQQALRPDGILVLGKAELIPLASKLFEPVDLARRMYRKDHRGDLAPRADGLPRAPVDREEPRQRTDAENGAPIAEAADAEPGWPEAYYRDLVQSSPAPTIATALDGTVAVWNRAATRLWGKSQAKTAGKRLQDLGLGGLSGELLVEKSGAVRRGESEREWSDGTLLRGDESEKTSIRVEVSLVRCRDGKPVGLVYVVEDVTQLRRVEDDVRRANEELQSSNAELQATNEELQSSNEELETTNEELQSANEELQTTNEELQSTNEELETTNEELQSVNEELDTTNTELASRTEQMHVLSLYQRTLMRSLRAAVVVLDANGQVSSWNLAAERLLGVPESEAIGQPFWNMAVPALKRSLIVDMRKALAENRAWRTTSVPYELPGGGKGSGTIVAVPLNEGRVALGAAILVEDTTRQTAMEKENERLRALIRGRGRGKAR